jgi:TolA-binding protein
VEKLAEEDNQMFRIQRVAMAALVAAALAAPAVAQQNYSQVTQTDIQRLQDSVFQAGSDVQQLKSRDTARASQLQTQLDDLRDEVIYLKVKLRKEGSLQRSEYAGVRDRLDDLRSQATNYTTNYTPSTGGNASAATGTTGNTTYRPSTGSAATGSQSSSTTRNTAPSQSTAAGREVEVPSGTEMDVRLTNTLNSGIAQVEDRFEGTTLVDLNINGRTVIPAGSVMRGVVTSVDPATRTNRTAKMTVSFDQVTVNGRAYPIRGTVTQAIQGEGIKGEAGKIATGAGVGAVLGGILGGVKGAILGTVIGGGGITAATEGKEVELPQGTVLRVRLDSPVGVQAR